MSYMFSRKSQEKLSQCDVRIQKIFEEVIKHYDCTIVTGHRGPKEQMEAFEAGLSKAPWGESKHNLLPSKAIDAVPCPVDWKDTLRFYHFAGFVLATATAMGIKIKWGGDWDMDNDLDDQTFMDLGHFELVD